ncbi:MAG: TetR/AcrR family transcriptional regulator [Chloroflexi bacterium]|nr:TetR/AcrR family transcriptional regulator [Chloroflexota bacterium]
MPRPRFDNLPPEKRERLLETAAKAFAANGYEHASMNQILADAGISKGAAYYYFDNKADLYAATVNHYLGEFLGEQGLDFAALTAVSFWPTLLEIYRRQFSGFAERPWVFGLAKSGGPVVSEMLTSGPLAEMWQALATLLDNLIGRGQELGVVRTDLPQDLLIALVMALDEAHDRWLLARISDPTPTAPDAAAERMVALLQRLLAPA